MNTDYFVKKALESAINRYEIEKDIKNGKIFDPSMDDAEWVGRYFYSHCLPEIMINIMDETSRDRFLTACEDLIDAKIKAIKEEETDGQYVRNDAISFSA